MSEVERTVDEWDGKQHKVMMCAGCVVSGMLMTADFVLTSCDKVFEDPSRQMTRGIDRCRICATAPDPKVCGICGGSVNRKWKP